MSQPQIPSINGRLVLLNDAFSINFPWWYEGIYLLHAKMALNQPGVRCFVVQ
jgi:hypothetical protein